MPLKRKVATIAVITLLLGLFYGLGRQVYSSLQAGNRLNVEAEELAKLQQKNTELKKKLVEVQSPQFVEKEARDKLNFTRPNETIVIIPQEEIDKILGIEERVEEIKIPNWQGWLRLFLK